jgi:arginyl-tRNA synthetase
MDPIRQELSRLLASSLDVPADQIAATFNRPPSLEFGEYALPTFRWAKARKQAPPQIAAELVEVLQASDLVETASAKGPYLNIQVAPAAYGRLLGAPILAAPEAIAQAESRGETIVIDYSSPNVAKPFHIGHLNTTVLGSSLVRILRRQGYRVEGVNHLGDWGTQFGKSAVAWRLWGDEAELEAADARGEGARYLVGLYVRFHAEAKTKGGEDLEDEAREWFRKLEAGDPAHRKLWERFIEVSLNEFKKVYQLFHIEFEHYTGESFYNDLIPPAVERLEKAGLLEDDEGAQIVRLEGMEAPFLVRKSDGATLYGTRDLAAAFYRLEHFDPAKVLYVVGNPQQFHFKQLFAVLDRLEPGLSKKFEHVGFGHTRFKNRSIKTREGDVIYLEDVLKEARDEVLKKLESSKEEKGDYLEEDPETIAWRIAASALVFGYLRNDRNKDIIFDWETAFEFKGDTGPGVQFSHAQLRSILKKAGPVEGEVDWSLLVEPEERHLLHLLGRFHDAVDLAAEQLKPSHIAGHLLELRQLVNSYLRRKDLPKIKDLEGRLRVARLSLVRAAAEILKTGLELLGLEATEQM